MLELPADVPTTVPIGTTVYKDECMFTFDTPELSDNGVDVDMKTFQGFSRSATHDFTADNYARTGNRYYLNITRKRKPAPEGDAPPAKIQKLEVKDVPELELWDEHLRVWDADEQRYYELAEVLSQFNTAVQLIALATSLGRQAEIATWEHEIGVCAHAVDVEPAAEAQAVDLSKCHECELTQNLWICLGCGQLGCGRQQFGLDLPGNSHALAHYDATKHPVAVKLGSLLALGQYDAYCYACNDEVKVPKVAAVLAGYGINLDTAAATEKLLVELNIDQNLKWEFNLDGANGEKLPPVFGKGLTGMRNLGNLCYLNLVVQALYSTEAYRRYFSAKDFDTFVADPAHDLATQLYKLYDGLQSGRYAVPAPTGGKGDDYQAGIKPTMFKQVVGDGHPEFATQRQQDAYEFLLWVMDMADTKLGLELNQGFKWLLALKVVCQQCHHGSRRRELVDTVSVPLPEGGDTTLASAFAQWAAPEAIDGFQCDTCGGKTTAVKQTGFDSHPEYLVVALQRITLQNWVPVKVDTPVDVPFSLDLAPLAAPQFADSEVEEAPLALAASTEFTANPGSLAMLTEMGFPENRAIKGLYNTGNGDAETAMTWLLEHMEDADIDEPLVVADAASTGPQVPAELVATVALMGFSEKLATKALHVSGNDPNAAVEWLFSHPDDDGEIDTGSLVKSAAAAREELEQKLAENPGSTQYKVKAVVCHKGTSPHTGHYVAFVRKEIEGQEKWVLFNDEKVVEVDDETPGDIRNNAYIYVFERV